MAFRTFDQSMITTDVSRRALFRGGAYAAAGVALATLPFGRQLLAHDVATDWPNIAALAADLVEEVAHQ